MNKRLELISEMIPPGVGFVDVGTDHGYLPVYMAQRGYRGNIIASDLRPAPLATARETALSAGVYDRISFRLCDGLDACAAAEIDTIIAAGMGGDTICGILDRAEWCMDARFLMILQPMTKAEVLRYWLSNNEFEITEERLVFDAGELYQIISARFGGNTRLSDAELFTGQYDLARRNELFDAHLSALICRFERAVSGMDRACAKIGRRALHAEILRQLYEMREGSFKR